MVSLQTKIAALITIALVTLTIIAGGYIIIKSRAVVLNDAELLMKSVSSEQVLRLNSQLNDVERATRAIHKVILNGLFVRDRLNTQTGLKEYAKTVERTVLELANDASVIKSVYVRFSPDVGTGYDGFFYVKWRDKFVWEPLTDINKYDKDDVEHVGWFWGAAKKDEPIWLAPYRNENIGVTMFSYIIPIFYKGRFIGVVGVDVDMEQFANLANINVVYKNAQGHIITIDERTRLGLKGKNLLERDSVLDPIYERISKEYSSGDELYTIMLEGNEHKLVFRALLNGMKYVVHAPSSDIYEDANHLIFAMIIAAIVALIIFNIIALRISKMFIVPLKKLNKATHEIANGNWDVDITCKTNDEIGELAKSVAIMSEKLKVHVTAVKDLAYKDALTSVKNKTAYNEYIQKIKDENIKDYAIIMFDVNNLKSLNDNHGHEQGDALIKCASEFICRIYDHSPVFRVGGDEFVAILRGKDYENRFALMEQFRDEIKNERINIEPFSEISIACGMAEWNETEGYDNVFRMADKEMYKNKIAMKQG